MGTVLSSGFRPCLGFRVLNQHPSTQFASPQIRTISHGVRVEPVRPLAYDVHEPATTRKNRIPILFLHGLFGSKKNNRSISKLLARDLETRVYALDLRNHGESPHDRLHDYCAMAEDVSAFLQDHGLSNVTVIGHSMGAKTAMTLALRWPDVIENLISVDNAPVNVSLNEDFAQYIRGMNKVQDANVTRQVEADKILQEFEPSLPIRQFLLGNLYRPEGETGQRFRIPLDILARSLGDLGSFPYESPSERRFEKPALFIRGTKSNYVVNDMLPVIGQFFPRFRLADIDAGHWLISERPDAFRRAVVDFLKVE